MSTLNDHHPLLFGSLIDTECHLHNPSQFLYYVDLILEKNEPG